ncbi:hypothetical protein AOLI_G00178070 [Acnodon oligacanthus]
MANSVPCSHAHVSGPKSKKPASEGGLYRGQLGWQDLSLPAGAKVIVALCRMCQSYFWAFIARERVVASSLKLGLRGYAKGLWGSSTSRSSQAVDERDPHCYLGLHFRGRGRQPPPGLPC